MSAFLRIMLALYFLTGVGHAASSWGEGYFPNLEVVDQDGRVLKFYDDVLKDKQVVVSFIFTSCQDMCPVTTARLAAVKEKLEGRASDKLYFVSLSVDPENDSPSKMKAYAEAFGAGQNWLFLTGKPADLRAIAAKLGNRSSTPNQHRNEIVLGNVAKGEWARNSAFIEPERLVMDIMQLDPEWRARKRDTSQDDSFNAVVAISERPGEALFQKLCSSCHTVGVGHRIGPDLRDVVARRDTSWLRDFIISPDKMMKKGDPIAIALAAKFPAVRMPALGLAESDAVDVIDYLRTLSADINVGAVVEESEPHDHTKHQHN